MIKIDLINRIELIEAQIENVKHSGHFYRKRNLHKYISTMELESQRQFDVLG
jgi:hypothetical protein